jgi:hypothetical protein
MNTLQHRTRPGGETRFLAERHRSARLLVQRTGIRFHNVAPERVSIEIEVENQGDAPSRPTTLRLESAPFGAFVRWSPLASLSVPAIAAGARATVQTIVRQPRSQPVGRFSGVVPPALLTAAGFPPDRREAPADRARATLLSRITDAMGLRPRTAALPPDLHDLLDDPHPHWAGNLNVWIGNRPVERHMAPRLRIHAGRANLAAFCIGDRRDEYAFRMEAPDQSWRFALIDPLASAGVPWTAEPWLEPRWHRVSGLHYVFLVVRPPEACKRGAVLVHVTQRSSMKEAVVEFDLDPAAAGPGCYQV